MAAILKRLVIVLGLWQFAAVVVSCAGWLQYDQETPSAEPAGSRRLVESVLSPDPVALKESLADLRELRWFHGTIVDGVSDESRLVKRISRMDPTGAALVVQDYLAAHQPSRRRVSEVSTESDPVSSKIALARALNQVSYRFESLDQWLWLMLDQANHDGQRAMIAGLLAGYRDGEPQFRLIRAALRLGAQSGVWSPAEKAHLLLGLGAARCSGRPPTAPTFLRTSSPRF